MQEYYFDATGTLYKVVMAGPEPSSKPIEGHVHVLKFDGIYAVYAACNYGLYKEFLWRYLPYYDPRRTEAVEKVKALELISGM